jgi:hypothetical protein
MIFRKNYTLGALIAALTISFSTLFAQNSTNKTDFQIHIKKATSSLKLDGDLSDVAWKDAEKVKTRLNSQLKRK